MATTIIVRETEDIAVDQTTGDIYLDDDGYLVGVNGADGRAQRIRTRILTQLGEWFIDTGVGVDWLGQVLVKNPNLRTVRALIAATIKSVPEVILITSLVITTDDTTRQLTAAFTVETTAGPITDEVTSP